MSVEAGEIISIHGVGLVEGGGACSVEEGAGGTGGGTHPARHPGSGARARDAFFGARGPPGAPPIPWCCQVPAKASRS